MGVFNLGGLGEMELLMEEVVDGGGVHAVQMIDHATPTSEATFGQAGPPPESHRGLSWGVPGSGFGPNRRTASGFSVPDRRTRLRPQFHSPRTQVCCVLRRVGMHPACHRGGNQKTQTQAIKISINEAGIHPAGALACVSEGVSC